MLASDANLEHLANTRVLPRAHRALLELTLRRLRPVHRQHALPARRFRLLTKEAAQQKLVVATQDTHKLKVTVIFHRCALQLFAMHAFPESTPKIELLHLA